MKKTVITVVIVTLTVVLILGACTAAFLHHTSGQVIVRDGLPQNTNIYFENVYYKDGAVHYTWVNNTPRRIHRSYTPFLQKRVDGKWEPVMLPGGEKSMGYTLSPFSSSKSSFKVARWLIYPHTGDFRIVEPYGDIYMVGYFTVTEP